MDRQQTKTNKNKTQTVLNTQHLKRSVGENMHKLSSGKKKPESYRNCQKDSET